ncbi:Nucleotide-binding universal stress protein, UspA family [Filimonas lacunae]|uniref:Nucleotide-binding universal stress protein, UspA family n=1 Tax=Filimonas lacunae TaxID=477680 RepID=A0A1N7QWK1_9BACT|nr:universal stress protein [Filimonas lacunae]SIT27241.1 Nucleotide-binding universal stress protein, UspA family [Filimonas lacunae]
MLNVLVLTDFSNAAYHAARYTCHLSRSIPVKRIILFHAYQSVAPVVLSTVANNASKEELDREYTDMLLDMANQLEPESHEDTAIDLLTEDVQLDEVLNEICQREHIDLVVMGIGSDTQASERSSNAILVPEKASCPVLVVPESAEIQNIKHVVFATDLRELESPAYNQITKWLDLFQSKLDVLNVDEEEKEFGAESFFEIKELHNWLDKYKPEYHYSNSKEEGNAIVNFARNHKASLILSLPRVRSFFSNLFHHSITKEITYHSDIPLLFLHEA